jgi:hypothetical protein
MSDASSTGKTRKKRLIASGVLAKSTRPGPSDHELAAVSAVNPFGCFTTAGPGFAAGRVPIFGRYFTQRFTAAAATAGEYIGRRKTILLHLSANFGENLSDFAAAGILDLLRQHLLLLQKFLQASHNFKFLS